jgi:folylpolyglutamate synthase/dihydropteroate synthase
MIDCLKPSVRRWIFTRVDNARAVDPAQLAPLVSGSIVESDTRRAIEYARTHIPDGMTVVICGSLYLIGETRVMLQ